jgi:metallo-beta-lactamase class B
MAASAAEEKSLGGNVWVSPLTANTWRVRSISPVEGFGDVESNALVIAGAGASVLIDTPVTRPQTEAVLNWAEKDLKKPIAFFIATHWHADRIGGLDAVHDRKAASYALKRTIDLAKQNGKTAPRRELREEQPITQAGVKMEVFYPGPGHTSDNLVVWIPSEKLLYGGCFIKGASATDLGNTKESDLEQWKAGVAKVKEKYGAATVVVPGHGDVGGLELLDHTAKLLEAGK